jgi:hypothetical protein
MDKVRFHGKPLTIDKMFAGMVEVKLCEPVAVVAHAKRVASREVKLNSMPVVDDGVGSLAPTELERRLAGANSPGDIDGGLLVTGRAWRIRRLETTPLIGAGGSLVAPMVGFLGGNANRSAERTQPKTRKNHQCPTTMHGYLLRY